MSKARRRFIAIVDEFGYDDGGVASFTFKVKSLKEGKVYKENANLEGCVFDDNACTWHIGQAF